MEAFTESAPEYAAVWTFSIDDADGQTAKRFSADGPVEVWLVATERLEGAPARILTFGLAFTSYRNADAAVELFLRPALERLNTELAGARDLALAPPVRDKHRHRVIFERFRRALPYRAVCGECMKVLVEDVPAWSSDAGIGMALDKVSLRERIEEAVNA